MRQRYRHLLLALVIVATIVGTGWAGAASYALFSDSNASSGTVQAAEAFPYFLVSIDGTNSPVTEGEPLHVNATITNNGSVAATQQLTLNVSNQTNPVDTQTLEIPADSSKAVTLTWDTVEGDGGNGRSAETYQATVSSEDEANSTTVDVEGSGGNGNCNGNGC